MELHTAPSEVLFIMDESVSDLIPWANEVNLALGAVRKRRMWEEAGDSTPAKRLEPGSSGWCDGMAASELDISLGVDLSAYNVNDTILSLPASAVCKEEAPSPTHNGSGAQQPSSFRGNDGRSNLQQILQHGSSSNIFSVTSPHIQLSGSANVSNIDQTEGFSSHLSNSTSVQQELNIDCRFQYVLAAATSIAMKKNEETLTYLNQGQPYEIKLKKLGELSAYRGKILKTIIRICFHERRLQYMEREQMAAWQASRPGDRIVEVDVPLSYGIFDVEEDASLCNAVEFFWDPTKEVGVYIKVNCISTEFTPKKHGGEKGVPFRIQVETYLATEGTFKKLHVAACQIKVFKLKGADRKHKQDKEKISKRPPTEQQKYQDSYECTVLNDITTESVQHMPTTIKCNTTATVYNPVDGNQVHTAAAAAAAAANNNDITPVTVPTKEEEPAQPLKLQPPLSEAQSVSSDVSTLSSEATAQQTSQWLQSNRFGSYLRTFSNFSGADIKRLSKEDLIQICGLPDGIRLFNALHSKAVAPCLTVYLCLGQDTVYRALYLDNFSSDEMMHKIATLLGVRGEHVQEIFLQGPGGIHIHISDDVVRNFKDESLFTIEIMEDPAAGQYRVLLKPSSR